jgi:hypothetical protein
MQKIILAACLCILSATACKKSNDLNPIIPVDSINTGNHPNLAALDYTYYPTNTYLRIKFYDLNHDKNSDKKVFTAEFMSWGFDTFRVVKEPQSIDSIAPGWPAQVKSVAFANHAIGATNIAYQVDSRTTIKVLPNIPSSPNGLMFKYDSTPRQQGFPNDHIILNSGFMEGRTCRGYLTQVKVFGNVNPLGYSTKRILLFPASSFFYDNSYAGNAYTNWENLSALLPGAGNFDWTTVDAVIPIFNPATSFARYFAIDFKNWRFFTWQERLSTITPQAQFAIDWGGYKSLDRLVKWPEGWGKK